MEMTFSSPGFTHQEVEVQRGNRFIQFLWEISDEFGSRLCLLMQNHILSPSPTLPLRAHHKLKP